jgi:glycosyltransferase involved in cell wall biosynthesis
MEEELKKLAGPNIRFLGTREKPFVQEQLKRTKALVFPSIVYEGLPNTILEAYSASTPVIASDIDNINSIVTNSYNGMLFKLGDSDSLAQSILDFETEPRPVIYTNARSTFEQHYSHDRNFEALLSVYQETINAHETKDN